MALTQGKKYKRVLVVDDEHAVADTLVLILEGAGYSASAVYSGAEAIDAAESLKPDLIISDVMMPPGIDGVRAAMEIMLIHPECRIVLFSGQAATNDLLIDAKARGYQFEILAKPIHPLELLQRIAA
ncbi:MAG TPA: response regulator [Terriglobales bacterium]|nr:response regulator [Terriglobales bacterium]